MKKEETIEILETLLDSVRVRGFKKTISVLKNSKGSEIDLSDPYDKFVVDTILNKFNISYDALLFNKYLRGDNKYAIGFCVYYLYDRKTLGEIHKQIFKNRNKTLLSKYRQMIYDLNDAHKADHKYLEIKSDLDKKIEEYKNQNQ